MTNPHASRRASAPLPRAAVLLALFAALALAACGGGSGSSDGGGDPPAPVGPDVTPPTVHIDVPMRNQALLPGDDLKVTFTANDDRDADVEVFLDADGDPLTTVDQVPLYTGTDQNGTPVSLDLATTGIAVGRYALVATADDGTNPVVTDFGLNVLFYAGLAGVVAPSRNAYGVVQDVVAFGVGEAAQGGLDRNSDSDAGDAVVALVLGIDGTQSNTGLTVDVSALFGAPPTIVLPADTGELAWMLREADQGVSMNGDPDTNDTLVAYASTIAQAQPTAGVTALARAGATDRRIVLYNETAAGIPLGLNGDLDTLDDVVAILDQPTNSLIVFPDEMKPGTSFSGSFDGYGMYLFDETVSGKNLNGDTDLFDILPILCDIQGGVALPAGLNNVDPTGAFTTSRDSLLGVYYVDEGLAGVTNGDLDSSDFIPAINIGGGEFFPGTGLNAGPGARYAFGDGTTLLYLAAEEGMVDRNGDGDMTDTQVLHWTDVAVNANLANTAAPAGSGLSGIALDGGFAAHVAPGWLSLVVAESANKDLNGDGDILDRTFMLVDLTVSPPVVYDTGLEPLDPAALPIPGATIPITGVGGPVGVLVQASEQANGILNGDGDQADTLLFFYRFSAPTTRIALTDTGGVHAYVGPQIGVTAYEGFTATDFNGDGDTLDFVFRVFQASGAVREPGVLCEQNSIPVTDDGAIWAYLRSEVAEQRDLNGDGDSADPVLGLWLP